MVAIGLSLNSCEKETIHVSESVSRRTVPISDFTELEIADTFKAYIRFSETEEKVEVEANDNLHSHIRITREGNKLLAKLEKHTQPRGKVTLNLYVTTSHLNYLRATGASDLRLEDPWQAENAKLRLSGASAFFGEVDAEYLDLSADGASHTDMFGSIGFMKASLTGSSDMRDFDLVTDRLDISLSGASEALVTVTNLINIDASGASMLRYRGDAQVGTSHLSGASQVIRQE